MRRKIRKFADREQTSKQTENSKTEATLVLCGSSGERANCFDAFTYHIFQYTTFI